MEFLGYKFKDESLIKLALTHKSCVNANDVNRFTKSNERMEFLGDAILDFVIGEYLYKTHKDIPEGELSKIRAAVVCETSLAGIAQQHNIRNFLKTANLNKDGIQDSMLADSVEAILSAIYLDAGMEKVRTVIIDIFAPIIEKILMDGYVGDYKTDLQEVVQKNPKAVLVYKTLSAVGPDHDIVFTEAVYLDNNKLATGTGKTKKEAQQMAAKEALALMGY